MTTDKGLCGGLNSRLNHALGTFTGEQTNPVSVVTVGRKGRAFALRARLGLVAEFSDLGDAPAIADLRPLCRLVTDMFSRGEVERVYLLYPQFVSLMVQRPTLEVCLPVAPGPVQDVVGHAFLYEPDVAHVLDALLVRYVEAAVYHAYLERVASEYAARMVAMHNATDSALELAEAMTMELNKSRQSTITEEICDVSAGVEALSRGGAGG
jgi:F-type H+-transporting ATPase subunit gamma